MTVSGEGIVFVGGTGRSGTHVIAELLGHHPRYADIPIESRFHCNKRGFPDLMEGRVTLAGFVLKLREFWWHRTRADGQPRGLYNLMRRARFDTAVSRFAGAYHDDPLEASRGLFRDLLWPWAEECGKPALVEMSSRNIKEAQTLRRLFPGARFVHAIRDGRDVASSVATKSWGPDHTLDAIDWWLERMRAIEDGVRGEADGGAAALGAQRLRVVVLDDLVQDDREAAYAGLLGFLGADDDPSMHEFFERQMLPEHAHMGRWREGLGRLGAARVRRKYERVLEALERERNHAAGALIASYERSRA